MTPIPLTETQMAELFRLRAENATLQTEIAELRIRMNAYQQAWNSDELEKSLSVENAALKEQYVSLQLAQASKVAELRQQLSEAQSRIELLEHDAKTGDYETLYAQTVVELSAAQVSESELLNALETLACLGNVCRYGSGQWNAIAQKAITTYKTRKEGK